jgi:hypothetical protein
MRTPSKTIAWLARGPPADFGTAKDRILVEAPGSGSEAEAIAQANDLHHVPFLPLAVSTSRRFSASAAAMRW